MQFLLMFASLASFGLAGYAVFVAPEFALDIAAIGAIGGFVLAALAAIVGRLSDLQRPPVAPDIPAPTQWDDRREPRLRSRTTITTPQPAPALEREARR